MDYALVSSSAIRRSDEVIDEYFPLSNRDLAQEVRNWPEDDSPRKRKKPQAAGT